MGRHLGVIDFLECAWHPGLLFSFLEQVLGLESAKKRGHQGGSEEKAAIRG